MFSEFGLSKPIVRAVEELGYTEPTPIQLKAIPVVLGGGDLLAGAQTGTGKTAGFVLPLLTRLFEGIDGQARQRRVPIRALILTPTRELAAQVEQSVQDYGQYLPLKSAMIVGGVSMKQQLRRLEGRIDILVATPGRLLDHMGQGTVSLAGVETLILDEADRMLDMGFINDIRKIMAKLPRKRQNLLFSATFSREIKTLADSILHKPTTIQVAGQNAAADTVRQRMFLVEKGRKRDLLIHLIQQEDWYRVLVFARTRHGASRLSKQLDKAGIPSLAIHGDKSQNARTRALASFKEGDCQVLVATDVAARGIDIHDLQVVINFELPNVPEDYIHRIGRTGRAGNVGEAVSLVAPEERKLLKDIERLLKRQLPAENVTGFDVGSGATAPVPERSAVKNKPQTRRDPKKKSSKKSRKKFAGKRDTDDARHGAKKKKRSRTTRDSGPDASASSTRRKTSKKSFSRKKTTQKKTSSRNSNRNRTRTR